MKKPEYLFSKQNQPQSSIFRKIGAASNLAIFLDYDGTLTPIRQTPSAAVLTPKTEQILKKLSAIHGIYLTIVTGRSLEDIVRLVPIDGIDFAANHGFNILQSGEEWIHPDAVVLIQSLNRLHGILRSHLELYPKAFVENKQFTLSIHYRNVPSAQEKSLKTTVLKTVRIYDSSLIITRGKKVLEVRPPIAWGKGSAVIKILKVMKSNHPVLPLFIGDDMTDEDVFKVLGSKGITIRVGKDISSNAKYYVKNVEEVIEILKSVITLRSQKFRSSK